MLLTSWTYLLVVLSHNLSLIFSIMQLYKAYKTFLSSAPSGRLCTEGMSHTGAVRAINIRTHLHQNRLVSIDILYILSAHNSIFIWKLTFTCESAKLSFLLGPNGLRPCLEGSLLCHTAVTWDLGFCSFIRGTDPFNRLVRQT